MWLKGIAPLATVRWSIIRCLSILTLLSPPCSKTAIIPRDRFNFRCSIEKLSAHSTIGHSVDKRVARSCTNHSQAKSRFCRSSPQPKFVLAWDRLAFRSLQWWLFQVYNLQNRPDWKVLPWRNELTRRVQDYWSLFKECFRLWLPQDHISDLVRFSILHLVLPSGSFPNHVLIDVQNVRLTVWVFKIGL